MAAQARVDTAVAGKLTINCCCCPLRLYLLQDLLIRHLLQLVEASSNSTGVSRHSSRPHFKCTTTTTMSSRVP